MGEVAKGRFEHRIEEKRTDEFGELYQAFDRMAQALQDRQAGAAVATPVHRPAIPMGVTIAVPAAAVASAGTSMQDSDRPKP